MDTLCEPLLLEILTRLDDWADVARCRVASKRFDSLYPLLQSINLRFTLNWYLSTNATSQQIVTPFQTVVLDQILNLTNVKSVCLTADYYLLRCYFSNNNCEDMDELYLKYGFFLDELLPMVPELKSICISRFYIEFTGVLCHVLPLLSTHCQNLVEIKLKNATVFFYEMKVMPTLTSLTLEYSLLRDRELNGLNTFFPNLQFLKLISVSVRKNPKIRLLKLKTFHCTIYDATSSLTLITPNLITLRLECVRPTEVFIEAPMLSYFHLYIARVTIFTVKSFEHLKTLWIKSSLVGSLLDKFQRTETLNKLTVESHDSPKTRLVDFNLEKVFTVFPNLTSLSIKSNAWSKLEACNNPPLSWEVFDARKGLKKLNAYLLLVDPALTFSTLVFVLNLFVGLSEVSFLIHHDLDGMTSKSFMSRCMAQWPKLKWRWGIWRRGMKDTWITLI